MTALPIPKLISPKKNHLLDALPEEDYERIEPFLERIAMPLGMVLHESGGEMV